MSPLASTVVPFLRIATAAAPLTARVEAPVLALVALKQTTDPATIVGAGESVTFFNEDLNAPHTVTFGEEIVIPPGPPGSPPPPPPGFFPYGGTTITSPSAQVNSGFLISQALVDYVNAAGSLVPPGFVIRRGVTFTFPNAGTYHYICTLHDFVGMQGDIIVRAQD